VARTTSALFSRRGIATAAARAAACTLSACGGSSSASSSGSSEGGSAGASSSATKTLRIGFSPFTLQAPALKGLADGLTHVAAAQGDKVVTADPKGDPSTQLQQLQQWVQLKQVDAIWVIPTAGKTIAPVLQQAQAKGIVVIASGVPADYGMTANAPGITFTNVDSAAFGTQLGTFAARCITERLGGTGEVAFLESPSGQQGSKDLNTSVRTALAGAAPQSKIASDLKAKDRLASQQDVSSALQGAPGTNAAVGTDDESTLGAVAAFKQAGKDPAKSCIVGAGGNDEALKGVKDGVIYAEVAFDFQADLMQNLKHLHELAANPKAPGKTLVTPIKTVTR
jgi:ABC-type sugar transport system substrate-binding protein